MNKNQKVVTLLCSGCSSCPEVTVNQDEVLIQDDFGGKVRLTQEQFYCLERKDTHGKL